MSTELKNKAYLLASRLMHQGHDYEVIRARMDKEGIPEELIEQVFINLVKQKKVEIAKEQKSFYNIALIKIGIGILLAIVSMIIVPAYIILPIGLIVGGIASAIFFKPNKK
jgi:hypothetical protein